MRPLRSRYSKALVTGASSGLGSAFTAMLVNEGIDVWCVSREPQKLPQNSKIHPLKADLCNPRSLDNLVEKIQEEGLAFDLLINSAGAGAFFPFEHFPVQAIKDHMQLLWYAPITLCKAVYPQMREYKKGAIVNVSSMASTFPIPYMSLYNSAKAALASFTASLMIEAKPAGVVIIDFQPGDFRTPFNKATLRDATLSEDVHPLSKVWNAINHHGDTAPEPERAARKLKVVLLKNKSGRWYAGSLFQTKLVRFLSLLFPFKCILFFLKKYYHVT